MRAWLAARTRLWITCCLYLGVALGGVYPAYRGYSVEAPPGGLSDSLDYAQMYRGEINDTKHRYRVLVPLLARAVPAPRLAFLGRDIAGRPLEFSFLVVNLAQVLAAVGFLHAALARAGFSWLERAFGGLLFLTATPVVLAAAVPSLDASTFLAACAMLWAVAARSTVALGLVLVLGTFAREPIVMLAAVPFLSGRFRRWVPVAVAGVTVAAWLAYKHAFDAAHPYVAQDSTFAVQAREVVTGYLLRPSAVLGPANLREAFQVYVASLPLALHGWARRAELPDYLRRCVPWVAFCFVFGFLMGNPGRISFIGFPMFVPFALLGLRRLTGTGPLPREASPGAG